MPRKLSTREVTGTIVPFKPHRADNRPLQPHRSLIPPRPPDETSGEQDREEDDGDDFPHRMKTNLATLAVVILLIVCGLWLADTIAQLRKTQDCVLSGRRNCTSIGLPDHER